MRLIEIHIFALLTSEVLKSPEIRQMTIQVVKHLLLCNVWLHLLLPDINTICDHWLKLYFCFFLSFFNSDQRTSLVVRWPRLHVPNTVAQVTSLVRKLDPLWEIACRNRRSHMLLWRLKILHTTSKIWYSQINIKKKKNLWSKKRPVSSFLFHLLPLLDSQMLQLRSTVLRLFSSPFILFTFKCPFKVNGHKWISQPKTSLYI